MFKKLVILFVAGMVLSACGKDGSPGTFTGKKAAKNLKKTNKRTNKNEGTTEDQQKLTDALGAKQVLFAKINKADAAGKTSTGATFIGGEIFDYNKSEDSKKIKESSNKGETICNASHQGTDKKADWVVKSESAVFNPANRETVLVLKNESLTLIIQCVNKTKTPVTLGELKSAFKGLVDFTLQKPEVKSDSKAEPKSDSKPEKKPEIIKS